MEVLRKRGFANHPVLFICPLCHNRFVAEDTEYTIAGIRWKRSKERYFNALSVTCPCCMNPVTQEEEIDDEEESIFEV